MINIHTCYSCDRHSTYSSDQAQGSKWSGKVLFAERFGQNHCIQCSVNGWWNETLSMNIRSCIFKLPDI